MNLNSVRKIFIQENLGRLLQKVTQHATDGSFRYRMAPMPELYSKVNSKREIVRNEIKYKLDLSDLMDWWFYWGFQDEAHEYLFSKIASHDVVLDVGANKCILTSLLSNQVGKKGKVYSFEANPDSYALCKQLLCQNHNWLKNCELIGKGCGSEPGIMQMARTSSNNTGMDRLVAVNSEESLGKDVEVVRLDDELASLDRIDLIKIDTEGFEFEVLKGASSILEKFKPKLFVELDSHNLERYSANVQMIIDFLKPFGYTFLNVQSSIYFKAESELGSDFHFDCFCEV